MKSAVMKQGVLAAVLAEHEAAGKPPPRQARGPDGSLFSCVFQEKVTWYSMKRVAAHGTPRAQVEAQAKDDLADAFKDTPAPRPPPGPPLRTARLGGGDAGEPDEARLRVAAAPRGRAEDPDDPGRRRRVLATTKPPRRLGTVLAPLVELLSTIVGLQRDF